MGLVYANNALKKLRALRATQQWHENNFKYLGIPIPEKYKTK